MSDESKSLLHRRLFHPAHIALSYAVLAVLWILASDAFLRVAVDDVQLQARLEVFKGLLFIGVTSGLLYLLLAGWSARWKDTSSYPGESTHRKVLYRFALIFALMLLLVPLSGTLVIKLHTPVTEQDAFSNLRAIVDLKARQIEAWLADRQNVGVAMLANDGFIRAVAEIQRGSHAIRREYVRGRLDAIQQAHRFDNVLLLNASGKVLLSSGGEHKISDASQAMLPNVLGSGQVQRSSLFFDEHDKLHIDFIVPLRLGGIKNKVVGAVVLHANPESFLFPYIQHWPSANTSGETLLVRKDGDKVVFLNRLRHQNETSQRLRHSLADTNNPAAVAASGGVAGTMSGTDYHGKPVLAAYRPIEGTRWHIVAKMDRDEIMKPLLYLGWWVSAVTLLAFIALGSVLLLLWRQQRRNHRLELERQAQQLIGHFYNLPFIGMAIVSSSNGRFIEHNDMMLEIFGYSRKELSAINWMDLSHPKDRSHLHDELARVATKAVESLVTELRFVRKDGGVIHVEIHIQSARRADEAIDQLVVTFRNITDRKQDEARIQRLTKLYAALSHCNQAIVRCANAEALFAEICRIAVELGGMKMAWIGMADPVSLQIKPVSSFGDKEKYLEGLRISTDQRDPYGRGPVGRAVRSGQPIWCQDFMNDPSTALWHERAAVHGWKAVATLPLFQDGSVIGTFALYADEIGAFDKQACDLLEEMALDISFALDNFKREQVRQKAEAQLRLAARVFEKSGEGFVVTDAENRIVMVNKAFTDITGYDEDEVVGKNPGILSSGHQNAGFYAVMWEEINLHGHWQGEVLNRRKNGSLYLQWLAISKVMDEADSSTQHIAILNDITLNKANEERMDWLAHFDSLTGLPNRTLLNDRCMHAIGMSQRTGKTLALMFLDLDHFKNINESLGHRIGDELLSLLGKRLQASLREQDTVSRLGGDDFVLVLPATDVDGAAKLAEKLLETVVKPYQIERTELTLTASIGIAMYPENGEDLDALSKCADAAMYRAKHDGRNTFRFFTPEIQASSLRKLQLENALRRAMDNQELFLHFQPQVSLTDGQVVGAEALLRWQHPEYGMVPPNEFIPIAESGGLILQIGEWVVRTAAEQMKRWIDSGLGLTRMAVNLSAVQLRQPHLPERVVEILREVALSPKYLELELTESAAMENTQAAIAVMDRMHQHGIRMSIDDFGTGYSSLGHLKRFKVAMLKIDRTFVRDIAIDADDRAIVGAVINLARSLGMKTIAEGVETEEQLRYLKDNGCDEIQGFLVGRPLPADQFERLMKNYDGAKNPLLR